MDSAVIKHYEDLVVSKDDSFDNTMAAINIAKKYISSNRCIIVGGQAIDYALKLKNHKGLYEDTALPDYDVVSPRHFQDAYDIATYLSRKDFKGISVINALHPSTMKVRVNFKEVCDITYVPQNILDAIPTLSYRGFMMVHPHFQYIDQHASLAYPYENVPRETIMHRPEKDMKRHDMLYSFYPLRILYVENTRVDLVDYSYGIKTLEGQCIGGFVALSYWISQAERLGFKSKVNFGRISFKDGKMSGRRPIQSTGLVLYSNNIKSLYDSITDDKTGVKFYSKLLDKLDRRIIFKNYELINEDQKLAAHAVTKLNVKMHIANLQSIMMYILIYYILVQKIAGGHRQYSYYIAYLTCREIITWAGELYSTNQNPELIQFFPTATTYGDRNISGSYVVAKHKFDIKNRTADPSEKNKYAQPHAVYDRDLIYKKTPKKYYEFNVADSEVFNFTGVEIDNFL